MIDDNNIDELKRIVDQHGRSLAAIVMEPTCNHAPGFTKTTGNSHHIAGGPGKHAGFGRLA